MPRAKLLLAVLIVFSIAGMTLAFKATDYSNHYIFTGRLKSGTCTKRVNGAGIMSGTPNVAASTASTSKGCPDVYTISISD